MNARRYTGRQLGRRRITVTFGLIAVGGIVGFACGVAARAILLVGEGGVGSLTLVGASALAAIALRASHALTHRNGVEAPPA